MPFFSPVRWFTLLLVLAIAIVVLGVDGRFTHIFHEAGVYRPVEGLGLATAALTILTLPVMIFTSMILPELTWLFILWVLWLTTAALATSTRLDIFGGGCGNYIGTANTACHELTAVEALSYVNWIILMLYTAALPFLAFSTKRRGHPNVWTAHPRDIHSYNVGAPATTTTAPMTQTAAPVQA